MHLLHMVKPQNLHGEYSFRTLSKQIGHKKVIKCLQNVYITPY